MIAAALALLAAAPASGCHLKLSGGRKATLEAPGAVSVAGYAAAHAELRKRAGEKPAPLETMTGEPGDRTLLVSCQTPDDKLRLRLLLERGKGRFMAFLKLDGGIYTLAPSSTLQMTRADGTRVEGRFQMKASLYGVIAPPVDLAGSFSFPCPAASHQCEEHR